MGILNLLERRKREKEFIETEERAVCVRRNLDENYYSEGQKTIKYKRNKNKRIKEAVFKNVTFYNCTFEECRFEKVVFYNCTFYDCTIFYTEFINCCVYDGSLSFMKCIFSSSNIIDCILPRIFICDSMFYIVKFYNVNLHSTQFERNAFFRTCFAGNCLLYNVLFYTIINWMDIQFENDNGYVKVNNQTRIEGFDAKDSLYEEDFSEVMENRYVIASRTYKNFLRQLKMNGDNDREEELLYTAHEFDSKGKLGIARLFDYLAKISCGYGEKWKRSVGFSLGLILIFAFIYMFVGIEITNTRLVSDNGLHTYQINYLDFNSFHSIIYLLKDFIVSIYFSTMTFTTVGYGNITTINYVGMIISAIEMFLGASMMAIMIGTILRKLTR